MSEKSTTLTQVKLYDEYVNNKKSASAIGKEYDMDTKQVTRLLRKSNIPVRSKKEAMDVYAEQFGHPRAGVVLSDDTKEKISESQSVKWNSERKTKQGKKISDKWKAGEYSYMILEKAHLGLREAAKNGSSYERLIVKALEDRGIKCITQGDIIYENLNMKVDIFCPAISFVCEVDGAFHMSPIHGQERLDKQILSDQEKNAHLLSKGLKVLRFKIWIKHTSQRHERKIVEEFNKALDMTLKYGGVQMWDYGKENEE